MEDHIRAMTLLLVIAILEILVLRGLEGICAKASSPSLPLDTIESIYQIILC